MIVFLKRWGLLNPWVWMFTTTSALQVFRGSRLDTVIFVASTILIWVSASGILGDSMAQRIRVKRSTIFISALFIVVFLTVFPRHSAAHMFVVLAILPFVLRLVWYRDSGRKEKADARLSRAKGIWLVLCLGITTWEFMANILGQFANNLWEFPTLSWLIDPWLDSIYGQAAFVALWLLTGVGFMGLWRQK